MGKFQGQYRIKSTRLHNWNYGWNATYFITICTLNKKHYFGEIVNEDMILSELGEISKKYWHEIPKHFSFVKLESFITMPNHIHGILVINKEIPQENITHTYGPQSQNLSSIIRGYKIGVTKNGRKIDPEFAWQPRFHDHIIRDEKAYQKITEYIKNNPKNWKNDTFNTT